MKKSEMKTRLARRIHEKWGGDYQRVAAVALDILLDEGMEYVERVSESKPTYTWMGMSKYQTGVEVYTTTNIGFEDEKE